MSHLASWTVSPAWTPWCHQKTSLLTLARLRLEDADEPSAEQGWVDRDRLLKLLGVDANALNVAIYRARGQLPAGGVDGAAGVVEVRRGRRPLGVGRVGSRQAGLLSSSAAARRP